MATIHRSKYLVNANDKLGSAFESAASKFVTYIRPLMASEGEGFAICSDRGKVLAQFPSFYAAYYTARQFSLTPKMVN